MEKNLMLDWLERQRNLRLSLLATPQPEPGPNVRNKGVDKNRVQGDLLIIDNLIELARHAK